MSTFLDTSGLYAVLDAGDANHRAAAEAWRELVDSGEPLLTTNYVIVETDALVRRRLGVAVARRLHGDIVPVVTIAWIDEGLHASAVSAALATDRDGPSLVDCASFEVLRARGIDQALAFDEHFSDRGYRLKERGSQG